MKHIPKRGPRVMHGVAAMMAQARDIKPQQGEVLKANEVQLMHDVKVVIHRLGQVSLLIDAYREQVKVIPEDDLVRKTVEKMLDSFDAALKGTL